MFNDIKTFDIPLGVTHWMQLYKDVRSVFIWGKGDSGKTQMARSILQMLIDEKYPGKHFTFFPCHGKLDELQFYNPSIHKGVLMDDIKIKDVYSPEDVLQILSVKDRSTIQCRFRNGVIPAGHYKIITHNERFEKWLPEIQNEHQLQACYNRTVVVQIPENKKLYQTDTSNNKDWEECKRLVFSENNPPPINQETISEIMNAIAHEFDSLNEEFLIPLQNEIIMTQLQEFDDEVKEEKNDDLYPNTPTKEFDSNITIPGEVFASDRYIRVLTFMPLPESEPDPSNKIIIE